MVPAQRAAWVSRAKNGAISTVVSNEISVTTSPSTGINFTSQSLNMRAVNGKIIFNTEAGRSVEIYNSLGQKLTSAISTEGLNSIPVGTKGIVLVKIGNEVIKLITE